MHAKCLLWLLWLVPCRPGKLLERQTFLPLAIKAVGESRFNQIWTATWQDRHMARPPHITLTASFGFLLLSMCIGVGLVVFALQLFFPRFVGVDTGAHDFCFVCGLLNGGRGGSKGKRTACKGAVSANWDFQYVPMLQD